MKPKTSEDLFGLVLAGGRSSRMGFDKGLIEYHPHQPQRVYVFNLLRQFCSQTFLGLRKDQLTETGELPVITDSENYHGPFKSILAAHQAHPKKAWLVVACDLPFLTEHTLTKLVNERDRNKSATAYYHQQECFPEPLLTIWEPEGLHLATSYANTGNYSPGKFLESTDYKKVFIENQQELLNANKPEDYKQAKEKLAQGGKLVKELNSSS